MSTTLDQAASAAEHVPRGSLPQRMRALYVATPSRTGAWLAEALSADSAAAVNLEEATGLAAGLARLRDEVFDVVLVSHEPDVLDALALAEGIRGSGDGSPLVVLGSQSEQEMMAVCLEAGADAYLCVHTATTRALLWIVARANERHRLLRENRRLVQADQARLREEHAEAERLLAQQRELVRELQALADDEAPRADGGDGPCAAEVSPGQTTPPALPERLVGHYRELLRAYVIMGSGNLSEEMRSLADLLAAAGVAPRDAMQLHVFVLEELVRGLGNRSARHVMARADLLALDVTVHLAEAYRQRFRHCARPPRQCLLPGF